MIQVQVHSNAGRKHRLRHFIVILCGLWLALWPCPVLKASDDVRGSSVDRSQQVVASLSSGTPGISELVTRHAARLGVDPNLVLAVVRQESGFNRRAVSPKGAMGLMQLMPGTAAQMGVQDPFDPEQNIIGGISYLRHCLVRFDGDLTKALAAYNAGPENVERYGGCPPFEETRTYIARVMRTYSGQEPLFPTASNWLPTRSGPLSPAALAVLRELNPYRYASRRKPATDQTDIPAQRKTNLSESARSVLRELYPYRHQNNAATSGRRRARILD